MSDFTIRHTALSEANTEFKAAVNRAIAIIDHLNGVLRNVDTATQGSQVPLWEGQQAVWNTAQADMQNRLKSGADASLQAHDWFKEGEQASVRIMS
jgi:hypothetical protein